jgi:integrase
MYSGMRLGEILKARREDVSGVGCFVVPDGKTHNSARVIPVHPMLKDVEVKTELNDKALSVRFGRLKKGIGIDDKTKVFHSLRKCFTTKLEQAGCPEGIAVRLLGHKPISLSYSLYSSGQGVLELQRWVNSVNYRLPWVA